MGEYGGDRVMLHVGDGCVMSHIGIRDVTNRNASCLVRGCTAMRMYRTRYWRRWTRYSIWWRRRPFINSTISWIGIWVTWLIPICDMTHSHVYTWLIPMSDSSDLLSFENSTVSWINIWVTWLILCVTWLIPIFDMTHSHCVTHRIRLREADDVMDRCVGRHDAIVCATWLIPMCTHDAFPCVISFIHCFPKPGRCHG